MAFCRDCWRKVPARVKGRVLRSWDSVHGSGEALDAYGDHADLLLRVAECLEGDREWQDVAP